MNEDIEEGLVNEYTSYWASRIKTKEGNEFIISSPEVMIAQKLERMIKVLGKKIQGENNETLSKEYKKDIYDLVTIINGVSIFYDLDELSEKVSEVLLDKRINSYLQKYEKYLPKMFAHMSKNIGMVARREDLQGNIAIQDVLSVLSGIYVKSKEALQNKEKHLPIAEDPKNSAKKIASGTLARNLKEMQGELKKGYMELADPTRTNETDTQSLDD